MHSHSLIFHLTEEITFTLSCRPKNYQLTSAISFEVLPNGKSVQGPKWRMKVDHFSSKTKETKINEHEKTKRMFCDAPIGLIFQVLGCLQGGV